MKAAQISAFGGTSAIAIVDINKPEITSEQVLVEVGASSINPFDSVVIGGRIESLAAKLPLTPGLDIAGTIVEIGDDVTGFAVGDKVYGSANVLGGGSGAFAEYAAANASRIAKAPLDTSDEEAASLPTAGISALQGLIDNGHLSAGQKVFINGGSGGIGTIAIQIAKALGATVATTTSKQNVEFAISLGADVVIDYGAVNFTSVLKDYDIALNNVYSNKIDEILTVLKDGGTAVSVAGGFDQDKAAARNIIAISQMTNVSTKSLNELAGLVGDGKVKPIVAKTYPLEQVVDAYADKQNSSVQGKVVIRIKR